nr:hypothetical protein [Tanacetum cinerariifolium]
MTLTFADTYNMIAYLTKSDASEGFNQIIDLLNESSINLVRNVDSSTKFYTYLRFLQLMIRAPVGDLSSHTTKYSFPTVTQKVFANMRMVEKGFSGVETPLFEGMIVAQQDDDVPDEGVASVDVDVVPTATEPSIPSPTPTTQPPPPLQELPSTSQVIPTPPPSPIGQEVREEEQVKSIWVNEIEKGEIIAHMDADEDVTLQDVDVVSKEVEVEKDAEIEENADDDELEPAELKEVVEVVTTAKLMTEVVTVASATITAATTLITAATLTDAPSTARRRKGVVIRDPEETVTPSIIIHSEPKSKDKGKGILDDVIEQVQRKEKEDNAVMMYQALKRKPQTEAQARKNMMIYLRNMAGFKMDYFKGMRYDEIQARRALKRASKSQAEKAAKKQKLNEEVEELKKHIQVVPNDEDDVYTEAAPLGRKVPVVDYEIYTENNKPYYKIIRVDGSS